MTRQVELSSCTEVMLFPTAPFSFDGTFHKPSHYPTPDNDHEPGTLWQSLQFQDQVFGLRFRNRGTVDEPRVQLCVFHHDRQPPPELPAIVEEVEYRFDLRTNLAEFLKSCGQDNVLAPALARWRGMRVSTAYSFYEFLVVTTLLQNTVIRRTVQMMKNLHESFGARLRFDGRDLYAFWPPTAIETTDEARLRELKLGYRAKTLKRQAHDLAGGAVDPKAFRTLETEPLKQQLLTVYGIGPATAEYVGLGVFHKYDMLNHLPPWEQKIYSRMLFDCELVDSQRILCELDTRYGAWKGLAAHYLFEDLFWMRKNESIPWLEELIRL